MYDKIRGGGIACCMECGLRTKGDLFFKVFNCGDGFFLCPKCAKKLEREIASWHGKLSRKEKVGAEK